MQSKKVQIVGIRMHDFRVFRLSHFIFNLTTSGQHPTRMLWNSWINKLWKFKIKTFHYTFLLVSGLDFSGPAFHHTNCLSSTVIWGVKMVRTESVGTNPNASRSTRASTISGYRAVNCGKHNMDHTMIPHTKRWSQMHKGLMKHWHLQLQQCSHLEIKRGSDVTLNDFIMQKNAQRRWREILI